MVGRLERGEIRRIRLPSPDKERPVLILQRADSLRHMQKVLVVSITRTIRGTPAELRLGTADGMPVDCVANFFEIHTVPVSSVGKFVTVLKPDRWVEARRALLFATGFDEWLA